MAETVEGECRECGADFAIGNMDWLTGITGLDPEELHFCDDHLSLALEDVVIDLSVGGQHTRSKEFQQQQQQRRREREEGAIEHARQTSVLHFKTVYYDDEWDEKKVAIEMPSEAKHDLKDLKWELCVPKYDQQRQSWTVALRGLDRAIEHMREQGWSVDVAPAVENAEAG